MNHRHYRRTMTDSLEELSQLHGESLEKAKIIDFKSKKTLADLPTETTGLYDRRTIEILADVHAHDEIQHYHDQGKPENHLGSDWHEVFWALDENTKSKTVELDHKLVHRLMNAHGTEEIEHWEKNGRPKGHVGETWHALKTQGSLKKSDSPDDLLKAKALEFRQRIKALRKAKKISVKPSELANADATSCEDCSSPAWPCLCFSGLPEPTLKKSNGRISLSFDGSWSDDQADACLDQFKRRAKQIIREKYGR